MQFRKLKILDIKHENRNIRSISLPKPDNFHFNPGQFVWVNTTTKKNSSSPIALASGKLENTILLTIRKWGDLTNEIFTLEIGDELLISSPQGTYFPDFSPFSSINVISGGTGITPARSIYYSLANKEQSVFKLLYGVKATEDIVYKEEMESWNSLISLETTEDGWNGKIGLVTELIDSEVLTENAAYCVIGPLPMISSVTKILIKNNIDKKNIFVSVEKFVDNGVFGPVYSLKGLEEIKALVDTFLE
jgi:anaerobic sulfite reductase subunit B